jgi:D-beta-D-heptose 7-phosphate kinase/D-beta-D-heptose 1-phosphate adenosyltransferase
VDLSLLLESPSCTTHHKTRILAGGQYVVRVDEGGTTARVQRLTAAVEAAQANADIVILSDYGLGLLSDALIGRLAALRTQVPVIVDAKRPSRYRRLRPTAVTPNLDEAAALLRKGAGPLRLAQRTHAVTRADLVALTLGERGVFLLDADGHGELLPARPVIARSAVGAGDSFVAALALALAAGCTPRDAVIIGVETSGIAVVKPHTGA